VPLTKGMVADLRDRSIHVFRGAHRLPLSLQVALQDWMTQVTSDQAEAARNSKRKAAMGINPDGSKKPRGKFKPKGPPDSWKQMATHQPEALLENRPLL
jgi:hypothetical protein